MAAPDHPDPGGDRASHHFETLDGVRGLAIALVLPHNLSLLSGAPDGWFSHAVTSLLDRGWLGVQLFFVLSGFLITGILIDYARERTHYWLRFFSARVLRIMPLYYATLLLVLVVLPLLRLGPHPSPGTGWWLASFLSNWAPHHLDKNHPLPHFWSLAVEEQFYLLWPLFVRYLAPRRVFQLCLAVAAAALCARVALLHGGWSAEEIYRNSVCRMDALACGGAAAAALRMPALREWLLRHPRRVAALACALLLAAGASGGYTQFAPATQTLGYLFLSLGFALLVLAAALADWQRSPAAWARLLRHRVLRGLGRYSYGLYVLHMPLHLFLGLPLLHALIGTAPAGLAVSLAYVAAMSVLSLAAAVLSYHGMEKHVRRLNLRIKQRLRPEPYANLPVPAPT
jgi:peptidoglycan/LPS O-acetylase OafA/YrhL